MSIRLRLTLLYTAILALMLLCFGAALYFIQARSTLDALQQDLLLSGRGMATSLRWVLLHPPGLSSGRTCSPTAPNL